MIGICVRWEIMRPASFLDVVVAKPKRSAKNGTSKNTYGLVAITDQNVLNAPDFQNYLKKTYQIASHYGELQGLVHSPSSATTKN